MKIKQYIELKPYTVTNLQFYTNHLGEAFMIRHFNSSLKQLKISCLQYQCGVVSSIVNGALNIEFTNNSNKIKFFKKDLK